MALWVEWRNTKCPARMANAENQYSHKTTLKILNGFLVSKETVVLRRWERSKQKFCFIKRVD